MSRKSKASDRTDLSPVYTTENFWHGSGEIGTGPPKKGFGSDKICSVNNLSVPNFIRGEPKFLPVLGPSARQSEHR